PLYHVRSGELEPAQAIAEKPDDGREGRIAGAALGPDRAEMIDDDGHSQRSDASGEVRPLGKIGEDLDVPAAPPEARSQRLEVVEGRAARGMSIDADAPDPARGARGQLVVA